MKAIETLFIRFIKFSVVSSVLIIAYIGTSFVGLTPAVLILIKTFLERNQEEDSAYQYYTPAI